MRRITSIALLLTLIVLAGCRATDDQPSSALRFLAAAVVQPIVQMQSSAPLTQSSFRSKPVSSPNEPIRMRSERMIRVRIRMDQRALAQVRMTTPRTASVTRCQSEHLARERVVMLVPEPDVEIVDTFIGG